MRGKALLLPVSALVGCLAANSGTAQGIRLRGVIGMLREWTLLIQLAPSATEPNLYRGTLSMRHTGICEANGHSTKTGTIDALVRAGSMFKLDMKFEEQVCTLPGPLRIQATSTRDVLRCNGGLQIPVTIWSEPDRAR